MALEVVTEEIAQNLEEAAELTRKVSSGGTKFFLGGIVVGLAGGFLLGYRFNREKIRAEVIRDAEEEIDKMRAFYQQKSVVGQEKPSVEEVIESKGYSTTQKETPKTAVRSGRRKVATRPLPPPVPVTEPPVKPQEWNYAKELEGRSPEFPYIISEDEYRDNEREYSQVAYTYYAGDGVLCDSDDKPIDHPDTVVGDNLKFGHGSGHENIVFVRNDVIEIEIEICQSPKSYEEEVLGLDGNEGN